MNTLSFTPTTAVANELAASDAFRRMRPLIVALAPSEVLRVNRDIPPLTSTVLGALPEIKRLRQAAATLPQFDASVFDRLEDLTLALCHAHARYLGATKPNDDLPALAAEAYKIRELLYSDAKNLCLRGLIDQSCLEGYTGLMGYMVVATEVQHIAGVLVDRWDTIVGHCATNRGELDYAGKLALRMVRLVGLREQKPALVAEAADTRARVFTLVIRVYDDVQRAITFLRWKEGDAATIAPSLYTRRRRRRGRKREEGESAAPVSGAPAASPAVENHSPTPPIQ